MEAQEWETAGSVRDNNPVRLGHQMYIEGCEDRGD